MSSGEPADDDEDPGHVRFILIRAGETFDGQERVMSRAAYDLQVLATAHSASCGHPGYVPDDYLEHLDGLGVETTITAAELCAIGMWERAGGGYRVLDWEAVECAPRRGAPEQGRRSSGPGLGPGARGQDPGPDGHADGHHPAVRGMRGRLGSH